MALDQHQSAVDESAGPDIDVSDDARVQAVLAVLRGVPRDTVAREWAVDVHLLDRWVSAFVQAGSAQIHNRPDAAAVKARDRFLAAFAYDMRAPLARALGWVDVLNDSAINPAEAKETAARVWEALSVLADRVNDVELLVAAALGGLRVDHSRIKVAEACWGLDVGEIGGAGPEIMLEVDPSLFFRIIRDLWEAGTLAPAPRSRRVEVSLEGPWVEVRVVREADPIPTQTLEALFEPFDVDHLTTGVTSGLYLARALTVAHGGTIGVDQDDDHASLWVRVPRRAPRTEGIR